ncbi:hypothetical protein POSPLADRAFT_1056474 [Postia placenta MAD-698-R-SB12]|uniref:Uncharacterized protein n=1 Tax=Postia placenta MAD-698-R-SB12 TaxID=670580 RepID=A0A1X6N3E4_9APHY|nr:hypothetical protein POSPLADRAFT_1056474 [Postia placenta MAD-698-R-SB12]OSX63118.1 hypothetical protein POSPLADRAFT_1056474 [Postia placenta MAD-698-R-SB12]
MVTPVLSVSSAPAPSHLQSDSTAHAFCSHILMVGSVPSCPIVFFFSVSTDSVKNLTPFRCPLRTPPVVRACANPWSPPIPWSSRSASSSISPRQMCLPSQTSPRRSSPHSFTINLVSKPFAQHANVCAVNMRPHASKWALSGLTHAPSELLLILHKQPSTGKVGEGADTGAAQHYVYKAMLGIMFDHAEEAAGAYPCDELRCWWRQSSSSRPLYGSRMTSPMPLCSCARRRVARGAGRPDGERGNGSAGRGGAVRGEGRFALLNVRVLARITSCSHADSVLFFRWRTVVAGLECARTRKLQLREHRQFAEH